MAGIDAIDKSRFCATEADKIKLNWFCYELAMAFHDDLEKPLKKLFKAKRLTSAQVAEFATRFALELRQPVRDFTEGRINHIPFDEDWVIAYLPPTSSKNREKIFRFLHKAWDDQLKICEICPTRCISEMDEYCAMFDESDEMW